VTLSAPSYVIPGTYAENVALLAGRPEFQAVELLFFSFDEDTRRLLACERPALDAHRRRFRYSVHMPEPLLPEHEELIEMTADLAERYVVHVPAGQADEFARMVGGWRERHGDRFLLENVVGRPLEPAATLLEGVPLCCDTGHLLLEGASVGEFLVRYLSRVREIHLHGTEGDADHRGFGHQDPWFVEILPSLRRFEGVTHLEVFSLAAVEEVLRSLRASGLVEALP